MCRHVAYLGPPSTLATLLTEPTHSLVRQSWAPRHMRGAGTINADGFGVGWFDATATGNGADRPSTVGSPTVGSSPVGSSTVGSPTLGGPVRYRRATPIWTDAGFAALATATTTTAFLAAVRSASDTTTVTENACAPFATGQWLFSHNGVVPGWPGSLVDLARTLPTVDLLTLDAPTDAALIWTLIRHHLRTGAEPDVTLAATVASVAAAAPGARLNLLLTDGTRVFATTCGHSLYLNHQPGRLVVASEPLDDDPAWKPIDDGRLLVADRHDVTVTSLS